MLNILMSETTDLIRKVPGFHWQEMADIYKNLVYNLADHTIQKLATRKRVLVFEAYFYYHNAE